MESIKLHQLLKRQLKKLNIRIDKPPEPKAWKSLLKKISESYQEEEENRYTLERSLDISEKEMSLLYQKQKDSYEARLKTIIHTIPDLMFLYDENGKYIELFSKDEKDLYKQKKGLTGKEYQELFPKKLANFFKRTIKQTIKEGRLNIIEYELTISHEIQEFEARFMPTNFEINQKETVITIVRNITEAKRDQRELEHIANYDNLTNLPNRLLFNKRLKRAITRAKRKKSCGALFFLDLDRFKEINDNLGHDIGDELLVRCAMRLKTVLGAEDTLARFGGDEFVIIAEEIASQEVVTEIAEKIMKQFLLPFRVKKYMLDISTSIGISLFPQNADNSTQLIRQADTAMYHAKDLGRENFQFFTDELADQAYEYFILESKLKQAFEREEFTLVYQPQVRLSDYKIVAVEALIRWHNDELGFVSPVKFIPIAEKSGLIEMLSNLVVHTVCKQIKIWDKQGCEPFIVSINLSRKELAKVDMADRLLSIIKKSTLPYQRFEFEVTEGALLENTTIAFKNIEKLRSFGVLVSIDDFGTGFSSLSNLKDFLFDKLKIDRSFVKDLDKDVSNEAIIKATIAMAKSLNLKVIAEGVETKEQLDFLIKHGCDEMQGYLYSPPVNPKCIASMFLS